MYRCFKVLFYFPTDEVFGTSGLWWVACGFLVPTKNDGYVAFIENGNDNSGKNFTEPLKKGKGGVIKSTKVNYLFPS